MAEPRVPTRVLLVGTILLLLAFAATAVAAWLILRQPPLTPIVIASTSRA